MDPSHISFHRIKEFDKATPFHPISTFYVGRHNPDWWVSFKFRDNCLPLALLLTDSLFHFTNLQMIFSFLSIRPLRLSSLSQILESFGNEGQIISRNLKKKKSLGELNLLTFTTPKIHFNFLTPLHPFNTWDQRSTWVIPYKISGKDFSTILPVYSINGEQNIFHRLVRLPSFTVTLSIPTYWFSTQPLTNKMSNLMTRSNQHFLWTGRITWELGPSSHPHSGVERVGLSRGNCPHSSLDSHLNSW